jgi:hypothetical protein
VDHPAEFSGLFAGDKFGLGRDYVFLGSCIANCPMFDLEQY